MPSKSKAKSVDVDALKVEQWPIERLIDYARNPRKNDAVVDQMVAAIKEFGFRCPIVAKSDGLVVDGHLRLKAARKLGLDTVPVALADELTEAQVKAFRLLANRSATWAGWDDELLRIELGELQGLGFDLALTGFGDEELAGLMIEPGASFTGEGLSDPDDVPAAAENPVTKPGDLWAMGRHRLVCGSCTDPVAVTKLMGGKLADLCFSSPPYAQQRNYKSEIGDWTKLMTDACAILPVKKDAQVLVNLGLVHNEGEWNPYWDGWIEWMRSAGWRRFGWYVWDQGPGLPGDWNGRLAPSHEFIFHFNRIAERARKTKDKKPENIKLKGGTGMRQKDGSMSGVSSPEAGLQPNKIPDSVIRVMRHKGGLGGAGSHPAPFPVDLVSEILTAFSDPDDLLYEPFCGSGTQLIAAQKNGRSCYGVELAPEYADVCVLRWQSFAGQEARLDATGQTFADVQAGRLGVMEDAA